MKKKLIFELVARTGRAVASMNRMTRVTRRLRRVFNGLRSAIGLAVGGLAIRQIFRGTIGLFATFERQMSRVRAVAGATSDQMALLTMNARKLGRETRFTAVQSAEAQVELSKLGFAVGQINQMSRAILDLASISNSTMAESAKIVGATVRQFNLFAGESKRVVDLMAKSFTSSALDLNKFGTAMAIVGPMAKSAGYELEQVTAMLMVLADRGIGASMAGTGLRRVFQKMAQNGKTFKEAMDELIISTNLLADATDIYDVRGALMATILSSNQKEVTDLTTAMGDLNDESGKMSELIEDNLLGSWLKFKSLMSDFSMELVTSTGASDTLKGALDGANKILKKGLSENLIGKQAKAWEDYRLAAEAVDKLDPFDFESLEAFNIELDLLVENAEKMAKGLEGVGLSVTGESLEKIAERHAIELEKQAKAERLEAEALIAKKANDAFMRAKAAIVDPLTGIIQALEKSFGKNKLGPNVETGAEGISFDALKPLQEELALRQQILDRQGQQVTEQMAINETTQKAAAWIGVLGDVTNLVTQTFETFAQKATAAIKFVIEALMKLISAQVILKSLTLVGAAQVVAGLGVAAGVLGVVQGLLRDPVKVEGRISGNDILLSTQRTQSSYSSMGARIS